MDLPTSLETRSWKRESCFVQFSKHGVIQVDFLHTHNQTWLKSYKHEVTTSLKEELLKQTQDGTFGLMEAPTFEFETQNICCKCSLKQVKSKGYVNVHTFRNGSSMITTKGGAVLAYQFARTHPLRIVISCYSRIDQNEKGSCKMENKHKRKVSEYFCCTNVNDNNIEEKEVVAAMTTTILKSHLTIKTNSNSEGEQRDDCEDNVIHCKKSRSSSVDNENDDNDIPSILEDRKHPLEKTTASKPHSSSASLLLSSSSSSFSTTTRAKKIPSTSSIVDRKRSKLQSIHDDRVREQTKKLLKKYITEAMPQLKSIFRGELKNWRHDAYKQGGKTRDTLGLQVRMGAFTKEQREFILSRLTKVFCAKHNKYLSYIMGVLYPETFIYLYMKIHDMEYDEAENAIALASSTSN
eukprot:m.47078 g.47078  ORF g.47078 m.47078 type:complete len:408 (-) comp7308_c1_seq5:66-1289(-)